MTSCTRVLVASSLRPENSWTFAWGVSKPCCKAWWKTDQLKLIGEPKTLGLIGFCYFQNAPNNGGDANSDFDFGMTNVNDVDDINDVTRIGVASTTLCCNPSTVSFCFQLHRGTEPSPFSIFNKHERNLIFGFAKLITSKFSAKRNFGEKEFAGLQTSPKWVELAEFSA